MGIWPSLFHAEQDFPVLQHKLVYLKFYGNPMEEHITIDKYIISDYVR